MTRTTGRKFIGSEVSKELYDALWEEALDKRISTSELIRTILLKHNKKN